MVEWKMEVRVTGVCQVLDDCAAIISEYKWLLDCYVLDYFVDDHWSKLPQSWQLCFQKMDPAALGNIVAGKPPETLLPLSFLALLKAINTLSLPRQSLTETSVTELKQDRAKTGNRKLSKSNIPVDNKYKCGNHPSLRNLFLKHVKAKKRHEISCMCDVVCNAAQSTGCGAALDVGSGVGHLVRSLAYRCDLHAAGIERQCQLVEEARKLDEDLEYTASKHLSPEAIKTLKRPTHLNISVSNNTNFEALQFCGNLRDYGVVGLHPCGDLGPFLIRHFADSDKVKFICVVGCCYMKLTCKKGSDCGYPISRYLHHRPCPLSYESREIACHAIETYVDRLRSGNYEDLQVHTYRAALEVILLRIDGKLKHTGIRSIKHTNTLSFHRYCELALERIGVKLTLDDTQSVEVQRHLSQWKRVVTFYTLRLMLAPIVETILLLDRVLFLLERGFVCDIRPVFDPRLSPRNHIIVGKKLLSTHM